MSHHRRPRRGHQTISSPTTDGNTSSIHFDAAACEMLTRFITNLCLHCGDMCYGSESNVENSDDISPIIDLCPHNYVDICDDCGSVNRNFDDGFAAIQLCQHDEAICDDTNVGMSLAVAQLVNDDTAPTYSHIYKSKNTACSLRTQAASVACKEEISKMKKRPLRNQRDKVKKKFSTTAKKYIPVIVPDHIQKNLISVDEIKNQVIVFDGGIDKNPPLKCPDGVVCWRSIRIADGKHLQVVTADDPNKGLIHCAPNGDANFMLMSRHSALDILMKKGFSELFESVRACEKAKGRALTRGESKKIFGDDINRPPMYT